MEINKIEKRFLELIQYNVTIKTKVYAAHYFELSTLFIEVDKSKHLMPISRLQANELGI